MLQLTRLTSLALALSACQPDQPDATPPIRLQPDRLQNDKHAAQDSFAARRYSISGYMAARIRESADRHRIPLLIAYELVRVESAFDSTAVSSSGAVGLAQLMPTTALYHCGLERHELWKVEDNLNCGFSYLAYLHARYNSWPSALSAYNIGPRRHAESPQLGRSYVRRVLGI